MSAELRRFIRLVEGLDILSSITFDMLFDFYTKTGDIDIKKSWVRQFNRKETAFDRNSPFCQYLSSRLEVMKDHLRSRLSSDVIVLYRGFGNKPRLKNCGIHWSLREEMARDYGPVWCKGTFTQSDVDWLGTLARAMIFWLHSIDKIGLAEEEITLLRGTKGQVDLFENEHPLGTKLVIV